MFEDTVVNVSPESSGVERLPKVCGADVEFGNFILGTDNNTGLEASRALLREIHGLPATAGSGWSMFASCSPRDWGRRFLPGNGFSAYIDLLHLEGCQGEVVSAWDHVAAWRALLKIVRSALCAANRNRPSDRRIQVLVNNSDGRGNSYGSHLNFLITRQAWDNIFIRKVHQLLFLAAYQVSSIVFTGQGKVGSENGTPPCAYQLSQRADFFERLTGMQTTFNRPIVNSRDESLCGPGDGGASECARLHVIFFDSTLSQVASLLKVGVMQIILSMIEAGFVNPGLLLEDPLDALSRYSRDPFLRARAMTVSGRSMNAVDLQCRFLDEASRFVSRGGCNGIVPRADEIVLLWADTLEKLKRRDLAALSRRLDWALKLKIISRAMAQQPGLTWDSPQAKYLDHLYSSLDDREGLYWAYEKNGFMESVVTEAQVARLVESPPEDTRAWTRAMLLRRASPEEVDEVDWDSITFKIRGNSYWPTRRTFDLPHPLGHNKAAAEQCFQNGASLEQILDALESRKHPGPR